MEQGLLSKRFICEHEVHSGLDKAMIRNMHRARHPEIRVEYTFCNMSENRMYSVIDSHDSLTVEAFLRELRIPWNSVTEVELQCVGRDEVEDLRKVRKAA